MTQVADILVIRKADFEFRPVGGDGAAGLSLARLYQNPDRALTFQLARIDPGGISRRHAHAWEHEMFVHAGTGEVYGNGQWQPMAAGNVLFIPGNEEHQMRNTGQAPLIVVCLVPPSAPEL